MKINQLIINFITIFQEIKQNISIRAIHTAKTHYRQFETNIPRKGTRQPQPFYVSVSDLYIPTIGPPILLQPAGK